MCRSTQSHMPPAEVVTEEEIPDGVNIRFSHEKRQCIKGGHGASTQPPVIKKKKRSMGYSGTARRLRSRPRNVPFESLPAPPKVPFPPGTRGQGINALMRAARCRRVEDFEALSVRRAWLWGGVDKQGRTLLHHAVVGGHHGIINTVLQAKKQCVDACGPDGMTPLRLALQLGDVEVSALLLSAGADPRLVEDACSLPHSTPPSQGTCTGNSGALLVCENAPVVVVEEGATLVRRAGSSALLLVLQKAVALAVPLKDDAHHTPWTDLETQRQLALKWQQSLRPGSKVDACDCDGKWYEAEVVRVWEGVGGATDVRVHYRCWGRKFDEDLSLSSLRVLPPYSAVPRWRAALALGSPLESLSATWLGNPPEAKEERKWWDSTVQAIDRQKGQVLISVDGRAVMSRWVGVDGEDISMAGTHVKPSPFLGVPQAKDAILPSRRQVAVCEAAKAGDGPTLLSLLSFQSPASLALQYWRAKVGLAATASTPGLLTAAAGLSHPPTAAARGHAMLAPLLLSPSRPPFSITPNPIPKGATAYEVRRWEVLRWVVGELKEDLAHDLLHDYMHNLWD